MAGLEPWCRVSVVGPSGDEVGHFVVLGDGTPDIGTRDTIALLSLLAKRLGATLVLKDVSDGLRELVELAGLGLEMER